ncbi:hypothetical protein EJB05_27009, partial [Eragrostis curvula]
MEIGETAARVATPHDGKRTWTSLVDPGVPALPMPLGDVLPGDQTAASTIPGDRAVHGDDDEEFYDEDDELYDTDDSDSDIEFEDDDEDDPQEFGDGESAAGISTGVTVAPVEFLGTKARFASVGSTAGFMLLGAFDHGHGGGSGEITVHYRYARFTRDEGGGGVELYSGGKLHTVRFLVPSHAFAAADPASSLRLAGAAMADMVHPRGFTAQLQSLWSNLVAAAPVRVPPWAARVEVTVSAGILRCRDRTPERMASMRAALAAEPHVRPSLRDVGVVLHLPAPVRVDEEDDVRPAKRRRLAGVEEEEECAICFEVMERGLAAWPRCAHVFHGECLELLLVTGDQRCPLCRTELNVPGQRMNAC